MILSSRPAPALRQLIRYYYQAGTYSVGRMVMQPVPARSPQAIEFTFGTPYEVRRLDRSSNRKAYPIALIGAQTFRRVELITHGKVDAFTIVFQPGGLLRMFSIPAEELTNEDFDGEAVLGRQLGELERRLGAVSCFSDRVGVADEYLVRRRPTSGSASAAVHAALTLLRSGGCHRVSSLAHSVGLGIRQFERHFRREIGMSPKLYARIVRFEAALRCKAAAPATSWASIAHGLGYHDQMHMVHDFNRLSGGTPTTICGQLDMFVRPELACAGSSPEDLPAAGRSVSPDGREHRRPAGRGRSVRDTPAESEDNIASSRAS